MTGLLDCIVPYIDVLSINLYDYITKIVIGYAKDDRAQNTEHGTRSMEQCRYCIEYLP